MMNFFILGILLICAGCSSQPEKETSVFDETKNIDVLDIPNYSLDQEEKDDFLKQNPLWETGPTKPLQAQSPPPTQEENSNWGPAPSNHNNAGNVPTRRGNKYRTSVEDANAARDEVNRLIKKRDEFFKEILD